MFVDDKTFTGFRIQSMFDEHNGCVPYYDQIESLMATQYGPRNPLLLATTAHPAEFARDMARQVLENWRTDYLLRDLSMIVVDVKTNDIVSLLIVRTYRPHNLDQVKRMIANDRLSRDKGELLRIVKATLDQKALFSEEFVSAAAKDVAERFRRCVEQDSRELAKGDAGYVPLVMEGAAQLNILKKSPKGIAVHLGGLQVKRGAALGVKFTVSYVNDLSNSASAAQNSTSFGPVLFKDLPELTEGHESFSESRRKALFDQVKVASTTGGVSRESFPGEVLKIYDIDGIVNPTTLTSKI